MNTVIRVVATFIGGVATLYLAIQGQWAMIHFGIVGSPPCSDTILQTSTPAVSAPIH